MEWLWARYEEYVRKQLERDGVHDPSPEQLEKTFLEILSESSVTVLVQEPWRNSVRFKGLARYEADEMFELLNNPEAFLSQHFGGGKFKLNFHQGWQFVATQNFKLDGEPKWKELPEIDF